MAEILHILDLSKNPSKDVTIEVVAAAAAVGIFRKFREESVQYMC